MTPEEADAKHEWKGMSGDEVWQHVQYHKSRIELGNPRSVWADVREMMHAWLRANGGSNASL